MNASILPFLLLLQLLVLLPSESTASSLRRNHVRAEICYNGLGCFTNDGNFFDWKLRPVFQLPESPEKIDPAYNLYTRKNKSKGQRIVYNRAKSLSGSNFDSKKSTKILIHGFLSDPATNWCLPMKDALLQSGDYNVIVLDWSNGNGFLYSQATSNTRVVGALLAQLLLWVEKQTGASKSSFHVIGHSLGAHVGGYAGERMRGKLGRITGMDPAGPNFQSTHPEVRLDPTDAVFVDAIHTDAVPFLRGGFGTYQPLGHVDFYPNGGREQPGCTKSPIVSIVDGDRTFSITCNHVRVSPLMTASILNPSRPFTAVECNSYEDFQAGKCKCTSSTCIKFGLAADQWKPNGRKHVQVFFDTTAKFPFY